jgi:hypothetical protein
VSSAFHHTSIPLECLCAGVFTVADYAVSLPSIVCPGVDGPGAGVTGDGVVGVSGTEEKSPVLLHMLEQRQTKMHNTRRNAAMKAVYTVSCFFSYSSLILRLRISPYEWFLFIQEKGGGAPCAMHLFIITRSPASLALTAAFLFITPSCIQMTLRLFLLPHRRSLHVLGLLNIPLYLLFRNGLEVG